MQHGLIEVKGQRSCEIWQSLKKDLNAHGFVIIVYLGGGGGGGEVLAMLRKGHKKLWGGFNTGTWGFSHAEGQGYQKYPPLNKKKKREGGGEVVNSFTLS